MVNKLMGGSLVMPSSSSAGSGSGASADGKMAATEKSSRKIDITIGSQTLYGTVDGTVGTILGLGGKTLASLSALQRAMDAIVRPVGDLSRGHYRAWEQDQRRREACGFVDGDWIETFLDLDGPTMAMVVAEMNRDKRWRIRDEGRGFEAGSEDPQNMMDADYQGTAATAGASELTVEDVLGAVEELSMMH
ncbi:hypothetical protein ACHAXT_001306 [Thalassiosira profunda]